MSRFSLVGSPVFKLNKKAISFIFIADFDFFWMHNVHLKNQSCRDMSPESKMASKPKIELKN